MNLIINESCQVRGVAVQFGAAWAGRAAGSVGWHIPWVDYIRLY